MSDLSLRWFIKGKLSETGTVGAEIAGAYRLGADYKFESLFMRLKTAVPGAGVTIDVNDDGASIFVYQPSIVDAQSKTWTSAKQDVLREGSVITMDVDVVSAMYPCEDLTVQLDLVKV
jgi:hypothetical protein